MQNNYIEKLRFEHRLFAEVTQREQDLLEYIRKQRKRYKAYKAEIVVKLQYSQNHGK